MGTDILIIGAVVVAIVDAIKEVAPKHIHGLVTIAVAVVVGLVLSFITLPVGVVAGLSAVGIIKTARNIGG